MYSDSLLELCLSFNLTLFPACYHFQTQYGHREIDRMETTTLFLVPHPAGCIQIIPQTL